MPEKTETKAPCLHLRCKEMFYKDVAAPPSEHDVRVEAMYGKVDARAWWCQCTQAGRGPDSQPVNMPECSRRDRACYKGLEDLA